MKVSIYNFLNIEVKKYKGDDGKHEADSSSRRW